MDIGPNAQFLNDYFGANKLNPQSNSNDPITSTDQTRNRGLIVKNYLQTKLHEIKTAVSEKKIQLSTDAIITLGQLRNNNCINIYGYMALLMRCIAVAFEKLFQDFQTHLNTAADSTLMASLRISTAKRTPLIHMIKAGIDSAGSVWEAILKSIILKRKSELSSDEFKSAINKSKEMLLDLTNIPLVVLIELDSYLFKRDLGSYDSLGLPERLSEDVKSEAIDYDPVTQSTNLNFNYLTTDLNLFVRNKYLHDTQSPEVFNYYGCPGLAVIPLFTEFAENIFQEHFFPYFDELMAKTFPSR